MARGERGAGSVDPRILGSNNTIIRDKVLAVEPQVVTLRNTVFDGERVRLIDFVYWHRACSSHIPTFNMSPPLLDAGECMDAHV